jgi:hypothetical protein
MDKRVADAIRMTARDHDTPSVLVEAVLKGGVPSIRLVAQHSKLGEKECIGGCRIGGAPDLPQGTEWPRLSRGERRLAEQGAPCGEPLSFLIQVNLAEVVFADREQLLPKSGMLYFFFHLDEEGDEDVTAVLCAQGTELRRATVPRDLPADQFYRSFDLVPELEWTVPSPSDLGALAAEHLDLWNELEDKVAAAQGYDSPSTYGPGWAMHRLLGHAQFVQHSGMGVGERLLLQISSDAQLSECGYPESGIGATWHDAGRIYYLISEEALKAHRFAKAYAHVECA